MPKLTQKAIARRLKLSPAYVSRLVNSGRIAKDKRTGLIDLAKAKSAIATSRAGRDRAVKAKTRAAGQASAAARRTRAATAAPNLTRTSATGTYYANKAKREGYEAELKRLELEARKKALLPAKEVTATYQRIFANVRARFRRLGNVLVPRVAPLLAPSADPADIADLVLDEVDRILAELADDPLAEKYESESANAPALEVLQASANVEEASGVRLQASGEAARA